MSLPLSILCSGRFDLSHLHTALLFTVNIPSLKEVSLQNGTAKQTSPGITPRAGQTLAYGSQSRGLNPVLPSGGTLPSYSPTTMVPPGKPAFLGTHKEFLESVKAACWEEIRVTQNTFSGVWFHSPPQSAVHPGLCAMITESSLQTHLSFDWISGSFHWST